MFILSSISSGLEFWSVNNSSINGNSWLKVFNNTTFLGEMTKKFIGSKSIQDS